MESYLVRLEIPVARKSRAAGTATTWALWATTAVWNSAENRLRGPVLGDSTRSSTTGSEGSDTRANPKESRRHGRPECLKQLDGKAAEPATADDSAPLAESVRHPHGCEKVQDVHPHPHR